MPKRVTIADVAREAGVSMMSVSRAMNGKNGISENTRVRILEIADQLGYRPSGVARALATNRSCTVGLLVPDVANPFFSQIARGAEDVAHASGNNIFLVNTDEDIQREAAAMDSLLEKQVDGAILASPRMPQQQLQEYIDRFEHTVLINRELDLPGDNFATIVVDDKLGAQLAITHFIEQDQTRIGFIAGPEESNSGQQRLAGYKDGLADHGLSFDPNLMIHCSPDTAGGYQAASQLLASQDGVSSILAYNDLVAFGVFQACEDLGQSIPDDVAVIGVDDIPLASLVKPKLSTLRIDKRDLGRQAMQTLIDLIANNENVERKQIVQPTLILRESMQ